MISSRTIIEFGGGSTAMCVGINENNEGLFLMRSAAPGPIGREIDAETAELVKNDPDVVMIFTKVESLNNVIDYLTEIKEVMIEELNKKTEKGE